MLASSNCDATNNVHMTVLHDATDACQQANIIVEQISV